MLCCVQFFLNRNKYLNNNKYFVYKRALLYFIGSNVNKNSVLFYPLLLYILRQVCWFRYEFKTCLRSTAIDSPGFHFANHPLKLEPRERCKKSFKMRHSSRNFFLLQLDTTISLFNCIEVFFWTSLKKMPPELILWIENLRPIW